MFFFSRMNFFSMKLVLILNMLVTFYMTGIIWFVQIVHYPLFGKVGEACYRDYHTHHARLTGWVVAVPMLLELGTAGLLAANPPIGISSIQAVIGLVLVILLWVSTAFVQVPRHGILGNGYDADAHRTLVISNWFRTILWTLRSCLVCFMLWQLLP